MATTYPTFVAPNRAGMTQAQAQSQAGNELNPLYNRALQTIKSQLYNNQVASAEQSAARGLSHSGLAQDAMNKLALGAQTDIGNVEAERAQKIAALARQIIERDQDVGFRERQQAYNEWNGMQGLRMQTDQFNYQKQRDSVADNHWQQEFNLSKQKAASSGGSGGGGRRSSSRRSSGGGSSSSSSSSITPKSSLSGYTQDQINWYSNPANAPYAYGQKKTVTTTPNPFKVPYNLPQQNTFGYAPYQKLMSVIK